MTGSGRATEKLGSRTVRALLDCGLSAGNPLILKIYRGYATWVVTIAMMKEVVSADDKPPTGDQVSVVPPILCYGNPRASPLSNSSSYPNVACPFVIRVFPFHLFLHSVVVSSQSLGPISLDSVRLHHRMFFVFQNSRTSPSLQP